jgi:phage terminase large subunit
VISEKQRDALFYLTKDPGAKQVFFGGGAGSGKSFLGCIWQANNRVTYPGTCGFICRGSLKDLRNTTLRTWEEVYKRYFGWTEVTYDYNWRDHNIEFSNGSKIFLRHIVEAPADPDFTYLGSSEAADAWIDEVGDVPERGADILFSRLRKDCIDGVPKLLMTGNPGNYWAKTRFVKDRAGNPVQLTPERRYIPARVVDNPDADFVKLYSQTLEALPDYDRARLLMGDWDSQEVERLFFSEFKLSHVQPVSLDKYEPLWLSFDFNINPTTVVMGQKSSLGVSEVLQLDGGTERLCDELLMRGLDRWPAGLMITGDSSGNSGATSSGTEPDGRHVTDYRIIERKLMIGQNSFYQAFEANKRLAYSRRIVNYTLKNLPVTIDPSCGVLIEDLRTGQVTPDGKLLKNRDAHKQDAGDAFRYLINAWFPGGVDDVDRTRNLYE